MLKKLVISLICTLLFVSQAYAGSLCKPRSSLRVRIYNYSSYDCTLKNHYLIHGSLSNDSTIPAVIFRGLSDQFDMSMPGLHAINLLTYQCGEDQEITLFSERFYTGGNHAVTTEVLNPINMQATAKYSREDCDQWRGILNNNTVTWIIKDKESKL